LHLRDKIRGKKDQAPSRKHRHGEKGVELIEFAIVLPLLLVMLVGIIDFGEAWAKKDKLSDAVRDGARVAVAEFNDTTTTNPQCGVPCSVQAAANAVIVSLNKSNVDTCGLTDATSLTPTPGTFTWTYSQSCATNPYTIIVERAVPEIVAAPTSTTVLCTRVTVNYSYNWNFAGVFGFFTSASWLGLTPSTLSNTVTLSSQAVMANLN
jgi:Flp pilus assembly protein TadG